MFERGIIIQNRYEIIEEVGSGGMSVVYKAKCHVLNRFVAIKVLKPEFSDDMSFISKFRTEAQSAAGLNHPNIVNVFDVGEENGYYYIVMELVEGITLKEYIQQNGRIPYQTALDFITQIASGIEVAHENHTIHRDIKPQNIIVSKNGTLKVTDFGIAKAATSNTIASSAMGSVHYISPEQARGGFSDERSDIYSLGITLYEMLTGRVPFEGENNVAVALMHLRSEMIPPREYYPDIPVGLEKIVIKATQKKPEKRYLTTNALLSDLRKLAMDPNAAVGIASTMVEASPTIQISAEELNEINNAPIQSGISMFPVNRNSEVEDANRELERIYYGENDDEIDDVDEVGAVYVRSNKRSTSSDGDVDPKMEKIVTIGAIVATIIIAIIVIVTLVKLAGAFRGLENASTEGSSTEISSEMNTSENAEREMIDVMNMTEEEAIAALDEQGISYIIERDYSDTVEAGKVMNQSLPKGTIMTSDTKVTIVISKGKEEAEVPDVVGRTLEEAQSLLTAAGFTYSVSEQYDEEVEENHIISQTPNGGEKSSKGEEIKLVVSKGKEVKVAVVPDLSNKTVQEAESALSGVNLKLGNVTQEYSDTVEEGRVIEQSIVSGTEVKEETAVDVTISKGKKPTTVTYTATFSGEIHNNGYNFEEGESVYITLTLTVDDATHTLVSDYYVESALPLQLSKIAAKAGLTSRNASLVYSVKDEAGNDITQYFKSTGQAKLTPVEQ